MEKWKIKLGAVGDISQGPPYCISSVDIVIWSIAVDTSVLIISALTLSLSRTLVPCQDLNFIVG